MYLGPSEIIDYPPEMPDGQYLLTPGYHFTPALSMLDQVERYEPEVGLGMSTNSYEHNTPAHERRVGREERDATIETLRERVLSEHLTEEEFSERRDQALQARCQGTLDALTRDLPPLKPKAAPEKYMTQIMGNAYPFNPWRWGAAIIFSVSAIVLPGPIMAAEWHGFDNSPWGGSAAIFCIIGGISLLLWLGLGWAPSGDRETKRPKPKPPFSGFAGGRNY